MLVDLNHQVPMIYDRKSFSSDVLPGRCNVPAMDIIEQENEIVVSAELPGVKKEDIKITFENNILTISNERKPAENSDKETVLLKEIRNSGFNRSVKLGSMLMQPRYLQK